MAALICLSTRDRTAGAVYANPGATVKVATGVIVRRDGGAPYTLVAQRLRDAT